MSVKLKTHTNLKIFIKYFIAELFIDTCKTLISVKFIIFMHTFWPFFCLRKSLEIYFIYKPKY